MELKINSYISSVECTIACCDCLSFMGGIADSSIDLTVTSPPYDKLRDYDGYSFDFNNTAKGLFRITKTGGVVVWVVGDQTVNGSETGTSFRQVLYFKEIGFKLYDTMIYSTNKPPLTHRRYQQDFEYMFILSKGIPKTFNPIMIESLRPGVKHTGGHRSRDGGLGSRSENNRTYSRKIKGNIWNIPRGSKGGDKFSRQHPATFPDQLAGDHILSWSNEGDLIFDPFMGSGTTAKMALKYRRKFFGCDISSGYVRLALNRIEMMYKNEVDMKNKSGCILHSSLSPFVNSSSNFPRADRRIGVIAREATHHPPGSQSIEVEWEGPSFVSTCAGEYVDPDDADGLVRKKLLELARDCRTVAKELIEHAYRLEQTAGQEMVIEEPGEGRREGSETAGNRMEVTYESQETKKVEFRRLAPGSRDKEIDIADEL